MDFASLDSMTLADMQAEYMGLAEQASAISVRRQQLLERMSKLRADAAAKATVARLSDEEKAALRDELGRSA